MHICEQKQFDTNYNFILIIIFVVFSGLVIRFHRFTCIRRIRGWLCPRHLSWIRFIILSAARGIVLRFRGVRGRWQSGVGRLQATCSE